MKFLLGGENVKPEKQLYKKGGIYNKLNFLTNDLHIYYLSFFYQNQIFILFSNFVNSEYHNKDIICLCNKQIIHAVI
jgi:hypothetical protein